MQIDFHYYATYLAAYLAGYTHEESLDICYSAQFVDCCSSTILQKVKAPVTAATTQLQGELMDAGADILSLQNMTRIWASFHFLPMDLFADVPVLSKLYRNKYRLICGPNGDLIVDTVNRAKDNGLEAVGIAMHVMADTWAHRYFAGTPSMVINNTNPYFYELIPETESYKKVKIDFRHNPAAADDINAHKYTNSLYQGNEKSVMNLGHGRAGHLPDYSFARYEYLPAWGRYRVIVKDNPKDYIHAFAQMIYSMKYIRGEFDTFEKECYDFEAIEPWKSQIEEILNKRQLDSSADWKALGESITGHVIDDFDINKYQAEYLAASEEEKDNTSFGRFITAAIRQKSMVTKSIFISGNLIAGISADYSLIGMEDIKEIKKIKKLSDKRKRGRK